MKKRREISYDEDIIGDVYEQLGGAYSEDFIRGVMDASVNYTHQMVRYGDKLAILIPSMGWLVANRERIERMMKFKRFKLSHKIKDMDRGNGVEDELKAELAAMSIKYDKLTEISEMGESSHHPYLLTDRRRLGWDLFAGDKLLIAQKQEDFFKNNNL
jgi:hypothetical protein